MSRDEELDEDFNLDEFEVEADPMDAMMGDMEVDRLATKHGNGYGYGDAKKAKQTLKIV